MIATASRWVREDQAVLPSCPDLEAALDLFALCVLEARHAARAAPPPRIMLTRMGPMANSGPLVLPYAWDTEGSGFVDWTLPRPLRETLTQLVNEGSAFVPYSEALSGIAEISDRSQHAILLLRQKLGPLACAVPARHDRLAV